MDTPEQLIAKRIAELPEYVRQAIGEAQATSKLRTIGTKYHLRIDQQMVMEREVMLVMLGFDNEGSFVRNLVSEAKIPLSDAQSIAGDVGGEIFSHIRDAMRRMSEERAKPKTPVAAPAVMSAPAAAVKSVVLPSAKPQQPTPMPPQVAATQPVKEPVVSVPAANTVTPPSASTSPTAPLPQKTLEPVEKALSETAVAPTTSVAVGIAPAKKPEYSNDPYREAIE